MPQNKLIKVHNELIGFFTKRVDKNDISVNNYGATSTAYVTYLLQNLHLKRRWNIYRISWLLFHLGKTNFLDEW